MKQSYSVKAILRTDKKRKDGLCPIHYRITVDSKTVKLPSSEYEKEINWNKKDSLVKGSRTSQINCLLDSQVSLLKNYLRQQKSIGTILTLDLVKSFYSKTDKNDFSIFYDEFCKSKFKEVSLGTQKHYLLLKKRICQFKPNLKVQDIDLKFVENLDVFLRNKSVISDAGLFNRHKNFKTFIRFAIKKKVLEVNPYDDFKMPRCKQKFGHITLEELKIIKELDLSEFKNKRGYSITIDMFLFSCYTGLRCSDVQGLKWSNIINMQHLSLETQKTKKNVNLPLSKLAKLILMKYKANKTEKVFPFRTNECLNRNLKIIAQMCEIDKVVTFHMARHTFATILANANVNPFHIAQLMTHSNMKQTMTYVNSSVNALGNSVKGINAFN
ncbi:site-specific integrase [Flavobacterium antarcticum]|uniref:site-specific integrase n=1 Tax=Flavobacterium antarcticum TaxID=271155 RepID=UPI0003B5FC2A|nr:site-specific integrase [Flavobacterium antarcticum]